MVKKNFYENKIFEIKNLIANNEISKALQLLNEELSLSYIPQQYEQQFTKLFLAISDQKKAEQKFSGAFSIEEFLDALSSPNNFKLAVALSAMNQLNLHIVSSEIKTWIENESNDHRIAKIYMFEAMAEQNIDINIKFDEYVINPKKFGSIFAQTSVINIFREIENATHKKPFLTKLVFQNFKAYLLANYPKVEFSNNLVQTLIKVTEYMLDSNKKLTNIEKNIYEQIKTLSV